jgi:membrane fusion protein (multidrug efflux system)
MTDARAADRVADPPAPPPERRRPWPFVLGLPTLALATAVALVAFATLRWNAWQGAAAVQWTDDAYIQSDWSSLPARVAGVVTRVAIADYQKVEAGQVVVELDPSDYAAAVEAGEASLASAKGALANLANQEDLQRAVIAQAQAQEQSASATEVLAKQELDRQTTLLATRIAGTEKLVQQATAAHQTAVAAVSAARATMSAQQRQLAVLVGERPQMEAAVASAQANLKTARLRLGYTRIVAPYPGIVGHRLVQEGDFVSAGTQVIAIVPLPSVYVVANYKETQLTRVASGQRVEIRVDTFPDARFTGTVVQASPASGAVFALLPADNATGNFTKVVQRIAVKVAFDPGQPLMDRLKPGMSVETRIQTGDAR